MSQPIESRRDIMQRLSQEGSIDLPEFSARARDEATGVIQALQDISAADGQIFNVLKTNSEMRFELLNRGAGAIYTFPVSELVKRWKNSLCREDAKDPAVEPCPPSLVIALRNLTYVNTRDEEVRYRLSFGTILPKWYYNVEIAGMTTFKGNGWIREDISINPVTRVWPH